MTDSEWPKILWQSRRVFSDTAATAWRDLDVPHGEVIEAWLARNGTPMELHSIGNSSMRGMPPFTVLTEWASGKTFLANFFESKDYDWQFRCFRVHPQDLMQIQSLDSPIAADQHRPVAAATCST